MAKFNFKIKRKSLQWQLLSRFFLILTALFLIFGISQYVSMKQYLYTDKSRDLQSRFHSINLKVLNQIDTNEAVINSTAPIIKGLAGMGTCAAIIDNSGNVINTSNKIENESSKKELDNDNDIIKFKKNNVIPILTKEDYLKILNQEGNLEHMYYIVRDENNVLQMLTWRKIGNMQSPTGLIQLSTSMEDIQSILYRQVYIYLGGLVLILVAGSLLGGMVFKRTLNPLYDMTKTVENITVGELHTRLPEDNGSLEIDKLSESFNKMLTGIEISFENEQKIKERMRQFVSDASHELRTPLTSIHGFVEVLLRGAARNEEQLNSALKSILLESVRLTKLVQELLMITKLDQRLPIEMGIENINHVILEIYPQLQIIAGERQVRLSLKNDIMVKINKDQIKQIIINLTQNAVQYTDKKSGIITISTNIEEINSKKYAAMKITDNGAGISEDHIHKIFDRFFRGEFHRSREQGGYGLGLSIVKSIVEAHEGEIEVESKIGIGTIFTVYLAALP